MLDNVVQNIQEEIIEWDIEDSTDDTTKSFLFSRKVELDTVHRIIETIQNDIDSGKLAEAQLLSKDGA